MSLDLTKYRKATHDHIGVAGSYTDTFIEAQGASSTSASSDAFVRWVPNNKSGSGYLSGTVSTNLSSSGYLQYNCTSNGYHALYFTYYDDTNTYNNGNTAPGIRLTSATVYTNNDTGYTGLGEQIDAFLNQSGYAEGFLVIVNKNRIASNGTLNNAMLLARSWRHEVSIGTSSTLKSFSYATCITNIASSSAGAPFSNGAAPAVNAIGIISESLAGTGSGHVNGAIELCIEHDKDKIGHAGYGKDLASGFGKGSNYLGITTASQQRQVNINYANPNYQSVSKEEYVRATFEARVGQGALSGGGSVQVQLQEESASGNAITSTNVGDLEYPCDIWNKYEVRLKKSTQTNGSTPYININLNVNTGTGNVGFQKVDVKNLEVFKCGFGPDSQRDVAVHKWHVNALDIEESPADFKLGDIEKFKGFYDTNRNLADQTETYTTYTDLTGGGSSLRNRQHHGGSTAGTQGSYNFPRIGPYSFTSTTSSNEDFFVHEAPSPTSNITKIWEIGAGGPTTSLTGTSINHEKLYMAGVWMRVRRNSPTGEGVAPNRISLAATGLNSSGNAIQMSSNTSSSPSGFHMLQSIGLNSYPNLTADRQEWKLLNGFFLPSWMTTSERATWKTDYWGKWAGQFEHGEGSDPDKCMTGITGYGINTAGAGYVAGMNSSVVKIAPRIVVEQYSSTDLWVEFTYPFIVEIDPANFNDEGQAFFWDVGEA